MIAKAKSNPNRAAMGIFSVEEAAEIAQVSPITIQRAIALGELHDNRDGNGNVVFKQDIEAFIGRRRGQMTNVREQGGWFKSEPQWVSPIQFQNRMRSLSEGLKDIDDERVRKLAAGRLHKPLKFTVEPTAKMKSVFRSDIHKGLMASKTAGVTFGVSAIAYVLRDAAFKQLASGSVFGKSRIERLYESPRTFATVTEKSKERLSSLSVAFTHTVPCGTVAEQAKGRTVSVTREIPIESFSANIEADIKAAIELAF